VAGPPPSPGAPTDGAASSAALAAPPQRRTTRLVTQLYREADRIASRSPVCRRGTALGVTFLDPIFHFVVGNLSKP
jgi:hypothetical protein